MGVHITFVKSSTLDKWRKDQLRMMVAGGNSRANQFFKERGGSSYGSDRRSKFTSKAANLYKKHLKRQANTQETKEELDRIFALTKAPEKEETGGVTGMEAFEAMMRQASLGSDDTVQPAKPAEKPAPKPAPKPTSKAEPSPVKEEPPQKEAKADPEDMLDPDLKFTEDTPSITLKAKTRSNRRSTKSLLSASRRPTNRALSSRNKLLTRAKANAKTKVPQNTDPEPYAETPKSTESAQPEPQPQPQSTQSTQSSVLKYVSTGANNKYGGISSDKVHGMSNGGGKAYYDPATNSVSSSKPAQPEEEEDSFGNIASNFFASFKQ